MATTDAERPTAPPPDRLFVDANVLVFALLPKTANHAAAVAALDAAERAGAELWVSPQVVRELLVQLTRRGPGRKGEPVKPPDAADAVAALLTKFQIAAETAAVTAELLTLLRTDEPEGKSIHDANLVATMLAHGITRLLTHNVSDFKRYPPRVTVEAL